MSAGAYAIGILFVLLSFAIVGRVMAGRDEDDFDDWSRP